jgi:hypothetical protein
VQQVQSACACKLTGRGRGRSQIRRQKIAWVFSRIFPLRLVRFVSMGQHNVNESICYGCNDHREHTEWQLPISGIQLIMMKKSARSLYATSIRSHRRDISGFSRFPDKESLRRASLHLSLLAKSSFTFLHLRFPVHVVPPLAGEGGGVHAHPLTL